jgi:hypothetical protein
MLDHRSASLSRASLEAEIRTRSRAKSHHRKNEVLAMNEEVIAKNRGSLVPSGAQSTGQLRHVHRRHFFRRIFP